MEKEWNNDGEWVAIDEYGYNQVRVSEGNIIYCPYQGEGEILEKHVAKFSWDETWEALEKHASICRGE